jgi:hypothetical protein
VYWLLDCTQKSTVPFALKLMPHSQYSDPSDFAMTVLGVPVSAI